MKSELVKFKEMEILEQDFNGDNIMTVKMKGSNKVYIGVTWITHALGFNKNNHDRQVKNIQSDIVLSKGASYLTLPTKGGNQKALCIEIDYLPLWLAKISITPNMKNENPEVVDKLVDYQLRAKDVLAKAFLGKQEEWNIQRIISKHDRTKMTNKIKNEMDSPKWYVYSNFTDMIYEILFNKKAKQIRAEKGLTKSSQYTRDYLSEEELRLVDEAETIVTGLVALGFKYDYIKHQLQQKYQKQITSK